MKRLSVLGFVGLLVGMLSGCPIFNDKDMGSGPCDFGSCTSSGQPQQGSCNTPADCATNETCGEDHQCHPGDCTFTTCVSGFICVVGPDQTASCQPGGSSSSSSSSSGAGGSSSGG
jgi:hypothetical protein